MLSQLSDPRILSHNSLTMSSCPGRKNCHTSCSLSRFFVIGGESPDFIVLDTGLSADKRVQGSNGAAEVKGSNKELVVETHKRH